MGNSPNARDYIQGCLLTLGFGCVLVAVGVVISAALGYAAHMIWGFNWLTSAIVIYVCLKLMLALLELLDGAFSVFKWLKKPSLNPFKPEPVGLCPFCNGKLRTPKAKQCPHCKRSWHKRDGPTEDAAD